MGLSRRWPVYAGGALLLTFIVVANALMTLNIRELIMCASSEDALVIPRPVCTVYFQHFTTHENAEELDAGPGLAFSFAIEDTDLREAVIDRLLAIGVEINRSSSLDGLTPLNAAILANDGRLVSFLLDRGAQLDKRDEAYGRSAPDFLEFLNRSNPGTNRTRVIAALDKARRITDRPSTPSVNN